MARFVARKWIRFAHCDPAGIVFYPQYLVLAHEVKEDWFREGLGVPFPELIHGLRVGFPIVRLETDFLAPSRLGEEVEWELSVGRIGRASLGLDYLCRSGEDVRVRVATVLVCTRLADNRPVEIPARLRERMLAYHEPRPAGAGPGRA